MNRLVTGLAALAMLVAVMPADASASGQSCPPGNSGYVLWDVANQPYQADNTVDGRGNGDGWVCATPKKVVVGADGQPLQVYNFIDNRVSSQ